MGKLIPLKAQAGRDLSILEEARDVQTDTLAAIRLVASISTRLRSIDRAIAEMPAREEREAAQAAAKNLRETVRSAFRGVSNDV